MVIVSPATNGPSGLGKDHGLSTYGVVSRMLDGYHENTDRIKRGCRLQMEQERRGKGKEREARGERAIGLLPTIMNNPADTSGSQHDLNPSRCAKESELGRLEGQHEGVMYGSVHPPAIKDFEGTDNSTFASGHKIP